MAVEDTPLDRRVSPSTFGALSLLAAGLSVAIYLVGGDWPVGLGGLGAALFVVLALVLVALGRFHD